MMPAMYFSVHILKIHVPHVQTDKNTKITPYFKEMSSQHVVVILFFCV